jgi:hypothetical protein
MRMAFIGYLPRSWLLMVLASIACQSTSQLQPAVARYLVTQSAIDVGDGITLCLAVDPSVDNGVWWWGPGASGCASRSTGPGVFHAEGAKVSPTVSTGPIAIGFRLGTHSATRPFIDVRLVLEKNTMSALESGARVPVQRWNHLNVPEKSGRGPGMEPHPTGMRPDSERFRRGVRS